MRLCSVQRSYHFKRELIENKEEIRYLWASIACIKALPELIMSMFTLCFRENDHNNTDHLAANKTESFWNVSRENNCNITDNYRNEKIEPFRNVDRRYFHFWSRLLSFWQIREYFIGINIRRKKTITLFWYSLIEKSIIDRFRTLN